MFEMLEIINGVNQNKSQNVRTNKAI